MTLQELINQTRSSLADETVGVRQSWEETFRYTLRHFPKETLTTSFEPELLEERLIRDGVHRPIAAGFAKRWREVLGQKENK